MLDLFRDEAAEQSFNDAMHKRFGVKAGLLRHEYQIISDQRSVNEVEIKGGKTVIIATKYTPLEPEYMRVMNHVFNDFPLRDFLRGHNIPRTGGAQWYEIGFNNILVEPDKRNTVQSYTHKYITTLELTDKKTKRQVTVKIVGSAFDALDEAVKLLYGERGIAPAPLNEASMKAKKHD
jgi:hypothetical protein